MLPALFNRALFMQVKLLHTSDWHLGQNLYGFSRLFEQQIFLSDLLESIKAEQTDVLLISGDIFDVSNPSADAMKTYYNFLYTAAARFPQLQIILIAGNHDSPSRLEAPKELLQLFNITVVGTIETTPKGRLNTEKLVVPVIKNKQRVGLCIAVPFVRNGDYPHQGAFNLTYEQSVENIYRESCEYALANRLPGEFLIAMGHLYAQGGEYSSDARTERPIMGGINAVDIDALSPEILYTALGHLHKPQSLSKEQNIRYSGSPIPMSFSELDYPHYTISVTIGEDHAVTVSPVPVRSCPLLHRIPAKPQPVADVLALLQQFPGEEEQVAIDSYLKAGSGFNNPPAGPILEVQVLLTGPEPALKSKIEEVLRERNAHLVKINAVLPDAPRAASLPAKAKELDTLQPGDLLKLEYARLYKEELPDELLLLFAGAMEEALTNDSETKPATELKATI